MKSMNCPGCSTQRISFWRKWRSGTWFPIVCGCGAKIYPHPTITFIYAFVESALILVLGFWTLFNFSAVTGAFFVTSVVSIEVLRVILIPLVHAKRQGKGSERSKAQLADPNSI